MHGIYTSFHILREDHVLLICVVFYVGCNMHLIGKTYDSQGIHAAPIQLMHILCAGMYRIHQNKCDQYNY